MLRIVNFEEIRNKLNEISDLVDLYDKKDSYFPLKVKDWLKQTEKILDNNKLIIAGRIGTLRASLISAEQGAYTANISFTGSPSRKKIVNATASLALQQAGEAISIFLQADHDRFAEAEKQISQLVSIIQANGAMDEFKGKTMDTETLKNMWQVIKSNSNLAQGAINAESLVGPYDPLIIFNRLLTSV